MFFQQSPTLSLSKGREPYTRNALLVFKTLKSCSARPSSLKMSVDKLDDPTPHRNSGNNRDSSLRSECRKLVLMLHACHVAVIVL
jgi:hypothetical protein